MPSVRSTRWIAPGQHQARPLAETKLQIHILHCLTRSALQEIVERDEFDHCVAACSQLDYSSASVNCQDTPNLSLTHPNFLLNG